MNTIRTLREANKIAKELGLVRGKGTHNGAAFWKNEYGQIVTRDRLAELAGYAPAPEPHWNGSSFE